MASLVIAVQRSAAQSWGLKASRYVWTALLPQGQAAVLQDVPFSSLVHSVRCFATQAEDTATAETRDQEEKHRLIQYSSQSGHSMGFSHHLRPNGYSFFMPPTSLIGSNSLPQCGEIISRMGFTKALVITDKFLSARGQIGHVITILSNYGLNYAVFDGISPNPTYSEVEKGLRVLNDECCDFIVSFGGGSPHDAAKAISLLKTNGGDIRDYVGVDKASKPGFPLVTVGTTGTGSEMTRFSCITDEERQTKSIIIDSLMTPLLTVEDPAVLKMPRHLTAATGMDSLSHAIEAYMSRNSNPVTDANALHSIKLASSFLKQAHATNNFITIEDQKANSRARDMMGYASYLAAMAFNNAGLGLTHAMAHQVGGLYNLPHGVCCALLLPTVLAFNAVERPEHILSMAYAMGIQVWTPPVSFLEALPPLALPAYPSCMGHSPPMPITLCCASIPGTTTAN